MEGFDLTEIAGRYRVVGPLGEGGMAKVLLAFTTSAAGVSKLAVIKLLRPELGGDPSFVQMFLDEARLAALLSHPNVVHTYEIGSDAGEHFLVMEYLEGQALSTIYKKISRAEMPLELQLHVLSELLNGLDYAHDLTDRRGEPLHVVHRDVSPQNVMVTYDAHVKVLDFGIAKAMSNQTATLTGTLKGKVAYIAPEQAMGLPVDRAADVFGVGVMLWEALAGRRIGQGCSDVTLLTRRLAREEPRVAEIAPSVDPKLAEICDRAMAFDAKDRFPSCGAMRDALEAFLPASGRRDRARALAKLVRETFAEEREKQRVLVEAALTGTNLSMSAIFPAHRERTPGRERTPSGHSAPSDVSVQPAPNTVPAPAASPRRTGRAFAIAGALAAIAIALGAYARSRGARPAADTPASNAAQPTVQATAPASAVSIETMRAEPVAPGPASAQPVPSATSAQAGSTVAIVAATTARAAPVGQAPKAASTTAPTTTSTTTATATTTTAATAAPPAEASPTANTKRPRHTIDEKDPYAQ
jgi:serine/threonine-protein kinase